MLIRVTSAAHLFLHQLTGGRIGGRALGASVLIIITTGRRSGRRRTRPLLYLEDGDNMVIVGSNGGRDQHPDWFHNLRAHPEAEVQIGTKKRRVRAEIADEAERARLWPLVVRSYSGYERYQSLTKRTIPVVILRPME